MKKIKRKKKKEEINAEGKNENNNEEIKNNNEENKNNNDNINKTEEEEKKEDEENNDKEYKDDDDEIMGEVNEELNEAPGPIEGKQIVITGETNVPKEYFIVLLARLGARVTFSVSNKTTC